MCTTRLLPQIQYYEKNAVTQSVVWCLTRDRGVAGSSSPQKQSIVSLSKTLYPLLSTGSTQEDPS